MMPSITEGQLTFHFPNHWHASQYDDWSFFKNQFQNVAVGTKAIDILAVDPKTCSWKIEVKDYRRHRRTKTIDLAEEVATKVRDSLAGIVAATVNANDPTEKLIADASVRCPNIRVVLHLEQPTKHSKLFPRAINPANVKQKLRRLVKAIDPHPLVVEKSNLIGVNWTVV